MECAVCKFDCEKMLCCSCGNCKNCNKQISYSAYDYCNECSVILVKCFDCGLDLANLNVDECIVKLEKVKFERIREKQRIVELATQLNLDVEKYTNNCNTETNNINNTFNNYVELLKTGKTNFKTV